VGMTRASGGAGVGECGGGGREACMRADSIRHDSGSIRTERQPKRVTYKPSLKVGLITAGIAALLLSTAWGGSCVLRDRRMAESFRAVSNGMTQDQVKSVMGAPWRTGDCHGEFAPYQLDQCTEAYIYASAWAPLNPEYPVVWFDRDKQVVGKFDFVSP
jgi:hypothetical protein